MNKFALLVLKMKLKREKDTEGVKAVEILMSNKELLEIFNSYLATEFYGAPLDLLNWILANWEEIIKVIKAIIDMFSKKGN